MLGLHGSVQVSTLTSHHQLQYLLPFGPFIIYSHKNVVNLYVVYKKTNFHRVGSYPTLANALFGAVKLTKNADIDKYKYSGYGIGFDGRRFYSHPSGATGRNVIIFGVDMNSSLYVDNKGENILIVEKSPTQGLGEHLLAAEKMYSINFTKENTKFCLSLHYNGANSYLFVNGKEIHNLQQKILWLFQIICA